MKRTLTIILLSMSVVFLGLEGKNFALGRDLDCLIEPFVVVTITSSEIGLLEEVSVDRGDLVEAGQVVAKLDSRVEAATGAVNHARAKLTNERLADLELRKSTAELARRIIRTPVSGVVIERALSTGEFVKQDPIMKIAQLDPLRVEAFAPVEMLGEIGTGMEVEVMPEAPVGGVYRAKVTVVDRVLDAASGTFGVRMELPNPDYQLPAGLRCKVRFPKQ